MISRREERFALWSARLVWTGGIGCLKNAALALALVLAIALLSAPGIAAAGSATRSMDSSEFSIRMDFRPFTNPSATSLSLDGKGSLRVVEYLASRLLVTRAREQTLPPDQIKRLRAAVQEPAFQDAFRVRNFGGNGLLSGDQFRLLVIERGRAPSEVYGFVDEAPAAVRSLLEQLQRLAKAPSAAPGAKLDFGYVRSEPITREREKSLRDAGKIRFVPFSEFPAALQPILSRVIDIPIEFHPVQQAQFEQLLERRSYGAEVFVVAQDGRSASQLVLFSTH